MTTITGDVKNIVRKAVDGVMYVSAARPRPGYGTAGFVVDERVTFPIVAGRVSIPNVDPGRARFQIVAGDVNVTLELDVPDQDSIAFAELVDVSFEYDPPVVGRAQAAASEAQGHAERAETAADRVGSAESVLKAAKTADAAKSQVASDVDTVRGLRDEAASARDTAATHRTAAERAAASAVDNASEGVTQALESGKADIAEQVKVATDQAKESQEHARLSGAYAEAAKSAQAAAEGARDSAREQATAAGESARQAREQTEQGAALLREGRTLSQTGEDNARRSEEARDRAEAAASTSTSKAGEAAASAETARQAAASAKVSAPAGGWPRSSLAQDVRDTLTKVDDVPTRQALDNAVSDKVSRNQLSSALAGKMDAVTVSDQVTNSTLAKRTGDGRLKAESGRESKDLVNVSQLNGKLDSSEVSPSAEPQNGKIPRRSSDAQLQVPAEPSHSLYAASKQYVDKKHNEAKAQIAREIGVLVKTAVVANKKAATDNDTVYFITG